jgi:hypothetical protein
VLAAFQSYSLSNACACAHGLPHGW